MLKGLGRLAALVLAIGFASPAMAVGVALLSGPYDPGNGLGTINGLIVTMNGSYAVQGAGTLNSAVVVPVVTTPVNLIQITPAATGAVPSINIGGGSADANRNLNVAGVGTGIVTLGQAICTVTGATPVTCNGQRGIATTGTLTTAAVTDAAYVINNSSVATTSLVECTDQGYSGTLVTNGEPVITTCVPGTGTITVHITNVHAANAMNGTVQVGFAVLN